MSATYTLEQRKVFFEALRAIPGMLACKARADHEGCDTLAAHVMEVGRSEGLSTGHTWSIMFSAAMHWYLQVTHSLAKKRGMSFDDVAGEMAMLAAIMESCDGE